MVSVLLEQEVREPVPQSAMLPITGPEGELDVPPLFPKRIELGGEDHESRITLGISSYAFSKTRKDLSIPLPPLTRRGYIFLYPGLSAMPFSKEVLLQREDLESMCSYLMAYQQFDAYRHKHPGLNIRPAHHDDELSVFTFSQEMILKI
jgi:hypothetical protein